MIVLHISSCDLCCLVLFRARTILCGSVFVFVFHRSSAHVTIVIHIFVAEVSRPRRRDCLWWETGFTVRLLENMPTPVAVRDPLARFAVVAIVFWRPALALRCRRCRSLSRTLETGTTSSEERDILWKRLHLVSLLLGAEGGPGRRSRHILSSLEFDGLVVRLDGMGQCCGGSRHTCRRRSAQ